MDTQRSLNTAGALQLFDMHCHLDFCRAPQEIAEGLAQNGIGAFSQTLTPGDYRAAQRLLEDCGNVRMGVGMHPWNVAADEGALHEGFNTFAQLADETRWVGEVGLDFSPKHSDTKENQLWIFQEIARLCAREGGRVLSVHAVQSTQQVLDILESTRVCSRNTVIFHWFSGTEQEFRRALDLGCCFSFGPKSLATKRGMRLVQMAPLNCLLLETDEPSSPQQDLSVSPDAPEMGTAQCISAPLEFALTELCAQREEDPHTVATVVCNLSATLLDLH